MEIIFAGGSHYEVEGFQSICKKFDKVYVINKDAEAILPWMRRDDVLIDDFMEVECNYVFLCGYSRIITSAELRQKTFINVHGALLPKYRGMHSTFYAIMNGEEELGITFHLVDQYMDSGPILAQCKFPYEGQTAYEINKEIDALVGRYAGDVCKKYINGEIKGENQDHSKATYGAKRNLDDCYIDFEMSHLYMKRFFKALTPNYPQPMIQIRGKRYEVVGKYEIVERDYYGPIGRVVNKDNKGVWIKTKEGVLIITQIREYDTKEIYEAVDILPIGYRLKKFG